MATIKAVVILIVGYLSTYAGADLPTCSRDEFHYEYTECDSEGGRWRVSVPDKADSCNILQAPVRGQKCEFTCGPGQYLNIQGQQECQPCPPGTYSLGGGLRFDDWDHLPSGFAIKTESFGAEKLYLKALGRTMEKVNCSESGWKPKGNYVASLAGGCSASLIYSATLVRPGQVKFTYQHTDDEAIFHFSVQNNECQTVADKDSNRWPSVTGEGEWKTISVSLKSGLNLLKWKTMGVGSGENSNFKKPILISKIEITGVAYTSECTKCKNGTHSDSPDGATSCESCAPNLFSGRGARLCSPCPADKYSGPGAAKCVPRPPCSSRDYFEYNSPCDANNQTQAMYKWIQPKVCRDDLSGAVPLPPSGQKAPCPPCNPGMEFYNGTCRFCPANQHSDGVKPCAPCGASTAPVPGLLYKWWNSLPPDANITSACLSLTDRGCSTKKGWVTALDHIHSGKGHADDAYLVLSLKLGGFVGREDLRQSKASAVAFISFVFQLDCTLDCSLFFMMQSPSRGTTVIETWSKRTEKQQYTYTVTTTEEVTFTWAFQKMDYSDSTTGSGEGSQSFTMVDDMARLYSINVTNTLGGGAATCQLCPKGATIEGCIPCPHGHYIDPNTTRCERCPADTVVLSSNPWGIESCKKCGPGLHANDNSKCISDGHYTSPEGMHYDFTSLTGGMSATGSPLFTASGTQYFHFFNISLFGSPLATCQDNITYFDGKDNGTNTEDTTEVVSSIICRVTLIPPHPGDNPTVMAAQPSSLGDVLVNITTNGSSLNIAQRMKENGFSTEDSDMDVHFTYLSEISTSACRFGRTTIITLRCEVNRKGHGELSLPPRCPDGTCDGCNFHFMWLSRKACPICKQDDYEVVKGECVRGTQTIHYIPPKHCILQNGGKPEVTTRPCSILPFWLEIVISACVGLGIVLIILLIYCWKRNRKLEYKYCKLIESRDGKDGELPGADSCGLDEEEDDEHYDAVAFKESKGKQLFKKIKFMAKKDADNPFESIQLTMKDNLLT